MNACKEAIRGAPLALVLAWLPGCLTPGSEEFDDRVLGPVESDSVAYQHHLQSIRTSASEPRGTDLARILVSIGNGIVGGRRGY